MVGDWKWVSDVGRSDYCSVVSDGWSCDNTCWPRSPWLGIHPITNQGNPPLEGCCTEISVLNLWFIPADGVLRCTHTVLSVPRRLIDSTCYQVVHHYRYLGDVFPRQHLDGYYFVSGYYRHGCKVLFPVAWVLGTWWGCSPDGLKITWMRWCWWLLMVTIYSLQVSHLSEAHY